MIIERITGLTLLKRIKHNEINNEDYKYIVDTGKYTGFVICFGEKFIPCINMFGREAKLTIEDILDVVISIETRIKEQDDDEEEEKEKENENENEEEIDAQTIIELPIFTNLKFYDEHSIDANRETINALIKAVKQLDKKQKEDQ